MLDLKQIIRDVSEEYTMKPILMDELMDSIKKMLKKQWLKSKPQTKEEKL